MLPAALNGLVPLSRNLWWSWDSEATQLWASIDPWRWARNRHNPVAMLADVAPAQWEALAADRGFVDRLGRVVARFEAYLAEPGWCPGAAPEVTAAGVAYLSMEFGLHASLRIYSGGLGVLAGDHLRSASDLGVPLVGVGLMYRKGYFRQVIDDGQQIAAFPEVDTSRLPIERVLAADGKPLRVEVPLAQHTVQLHVWRVSVGRNRLYLLDSDHADNLERDRSLTHQLYGGDQEMRIRQEMVLGVGGVRALRAVKEHVTVFHLNEGHCAFAVLELMRERMVAGETWEVARASVKRRCVFTTHTPVPAGHDRFSWELVDKVLGPWRKEQKLEPGVYMDLGRVQTGDWTEPLCMTVLALRSAGKSNGVSKLHGQVSREMWQELFPDGTEDDVPIGHVTNGVHPVFWMAPEARALFDDYVPGWRDHPWDEEIWEGVATIPDSKLWELRNHLRGRLVQFVQERTGRPLDPNALTIGFARRFAPYKRGDLLFTDLDRLAAILDKGPVQVLFSGKAHPQDADGKSLVAQVLRRCASPIFRDRVMFLEDYDMTIGGMLTSGADIWLNNPRRPHEASGTSGEKALLNGTLNLSILDGWWAEAFDGTNGWAIGTADTLEDVAAQDAVDAESLYQTLETQVLPAWHARDAAGIPRPWVQRMRRSLISGISVFNSHRMVRDYVLDMYTPLAQPG